LPVAARRFGIALVASAAFASLGAPVRAQVAFDTHGYLRIGPGLTSLGDHHACYQLPGTDFKYRLGNECDLYGEFLLSAAIGKEDAPQLKLHVMPTIFDGTGADDDKYETAQAYAEVKGLGFAPQLGFWVGKRYQRGADVHIVDTYFEKQDGKGAGLNAPVLGGTLDLAYYRADAKDGEPAGHRVNAWWHDVPVNDGGKLSLLAGFTQGEGNDGKAGASFSVRHHQKIDDKSDNNVWLQAAQGSGRPDGNFGDLKAGSDVKRWRLVDGYQFQPTPRFGGQAIALIGRNLSAAGNATVASGGGRLSYAFAPHFKLLGELGVDRVKPDGGPARNLTKLTVAPTLAKGEGFWARPELRLFVTRAWWNQAADAAAGGAGLAGRGDGKTNGTSIGVQVETWW
jgi:maltoporin